MVQAWWMIWLPGIALMVVAFTGNLMGDWAAGRAGPPAAQPALNRLAAVAAPFIPSEVEEHGREAHAGPRPPRLPSGQASTRCR